jgi:hypothetical protein
MATIPSIVDNYVLGIIADLKQGDALDLLSPHQVYMPGKNFLRAQDLAACLDLLSQCMDTGTMTVVTGAGNTVRSLQDGAATFTAGKQVGNYVTFTNGTLDGEVRRIVSNTTTTLVFDGDDLPAVPGPAVSATSDIGSGADGTVTITVDATGPGGNAYTVTVDAPAGTSGLSAGIVGTVITVHLSVSSGVPVDVENTATLVAAAVDALAGVSAAASGTGATALGLGAVVTGQAFSGGVDATTYTISGGIAADAINALREDKSISESPSGDIYGDLRSVKDGIVKMIVQLGGTVTNQNVASLVCGTGSTDTVVVIDTSTATGCGAKFAPDQFKNLQVTIGSDTCTILRNDETTLTLRTALSSAPSASTAMTIFKPVTSIRSVDNTIPHPGAQPGENRILADLLTQVRARVAAYTVPT